MVVAESGVKTTRYGYSVAATIRTRAPRQQRRRSCSCPRRALPAWLRTSPMIRGQARTPRTARCSQSSTTSGRIRLAPRRRQRGAGSSPCRILRTFWTELMPSGCAALAAVALAARLRCGTSWRTRGRRLDQLINGNESAPVAEKRGPLAGRGYRPTPGAGAPPSVTSSPVASTVLRSLEAIAARAIDDPYEIASALTGKCMAQSWRHRRCARRRRGLAIARDLDTSPDRRVAPGPSGSRGDETSSASHFSIVLLKSDTTIPALAWWRTSPRHARRPRRRSMPLRREPEIYRNSAAVLSPTPRGTAAALCCAGGQHEQAARQWRRCAATERQPVIEFALRPSALT
jgi:hypothetical protein